MKISALLLLFTILSSTCYAETLESEIFENEDLSAIAKVRGSMFLIGSDEKNKVQVVTLSKSKKLVAKSLIALTSSESSESKGEIDIEGISILGDEVYVTGSHSIARRRAKSKKNIQDNKKRIKKVKVENSRRHVFKFLIDEKTGMRKSPIEISSLQSIIENDSYLSRFVSIPSKENGVDIEGLAIDSKRNLYFGFRGPVLRENLALILVINERELFSSKENPEYEIRFVNLNGFGIRDIAKTRSGFLILAGPVNDRESAHRIFFWSGVQGIQGVNSKKLILKEIKKIEIQKEKGLFIKPEGLVITHEKRGKFKVLIIHDSAKDGAPLPLSLSYK